MFSRVQGGTLFVFFVRLTCFSCVVPIPYSFVVVDPCYSFVSVVFHLGRPFMIHGCMCVLSCVSCCYPEYSVVIRANLNNAFGSAVCCSIINLFTFLYCCIVPHTNEPRQRAQVRAQVVWRQHSRPENERIRCPVT